MKVTAIVTVILAFAAISVADSVMAKTVSIKGHDKETVKNSCDGAYWPSSVGGTYGCLNKDGSGIVCGGKGKTNGKPNSKTCTTFREAPRCLPTRDQAGKADQVEPYDVEWPSEKGSYAPAKKN